MPVAARASADTIKRLESCINDLVAILALPAIWAGHDPAHIARTLVDVLVRMLGLDFGYVRLSASIADDMTEWARVSDHRPVSAHDIGRRLERWSSGETSDQHVLASNPAGEGQVALAVFRLGLQDELGRLIVGSQRPEFPDDVERLLLQVAVNQATIFLQEARHLRQQRRAIEDLGRRVAERTVQLAALNQNLRREVVERSRAEEQNRALAARLMTTQDAERARIAQDLHDVVCQELASVSVDISYVRFNASRLQTEEVQDVLTSLSRRSASLGETVRRLSHGLHPAVLQHTGLVAALEAHCAEVQRQHELAVSFSADAAVEPVSELVALSLFRIAQEALRNIVRHANAQRASVSLTRNDGDLTLSISDDGTGFDVPSVRQTGGLGLASIEERARLVRGAIEVRSEPGAGVTLFVRVPAVVDDTPEPEVNSQPPNAQLPSRAD